MKKKLFLAVCITAIFAINYAIAQREYDVTTPGGTTGYIPIWNSSSGLNVTSIGTSSLYNTNGKIGIGTSNPLQKLHIENGSLIINGNNSINPDINITKTTGTDPSLFPCISLNNIYEANPTKQIYNSTYQIYNQQGSLRIKNILDGVSSDLITFTPFSIGVPSTTDVAFDGEVTMRNNLTIIGNSRLSNRMIIHSDDATIELNNPNNTPPIVPSNFQILASNGAGRLSSDGDVCIFLDRENTHTGEFFRVYTNGSIIGGTSALLLEVKQDETLITNNLKIGANVRIYPEGKMWIKNEITIQNESPWEDYVFASDYNLKSLSEVEAYIKVNKHLPGIPSASEIEANGIKLGEITHLLTQKIEELTLYTIELQKQVDALKKQENNK